MPLPTFPNPISLQDLQDNFGGTNPISMNEYYRRGNFVADITNNSLVPTSGTISLENFYGSTSKITVVNNGTLLNVNMQTVFTINGINYWTRNIEKEYINNGTIGSNDATLAALTVTGGRLGTFTLRNTGSILGAGGNGARVLGIPTNTRSDAQNGGTAIQNNSSNYTLINTGIIYGGGGGGARGRNGGNGGRGGFGRYGSGFQQGTSRITVTRGGSCPGTAGALPCNTALISGGNTSYNWCAGAPADFCTNVGCYRYNYVNGSQATWGGRICRLRSGNRNYDYYGMQRDYRAVYFVRTFANVNGCAGVAGDTTGGVGGKGQGYDNQSGSRAGASGAAVTGTTNCCQDSLFRGAGCGGARGKGGDGSSGGTWGQSGVVQETTSATNGSPGLSGFNAETNTSTPGSPGAAPGNNPSSPGAGGFYLSGSAGNTITFTNTGTVLGRLS